MRAFKAAVRAVGSNGAPPSSGVTVELLVPRASDGTYIRRILQVTNEKLDSYLAKLGLALVARVPDKLSLDVADGGWAFANSIQLEEGATYVVDDGHRGADKQMRAIDNYMRNAATVAEGEFAAGLMTHARAKHLTKPKLLRFKQLTSPADSKRKIDAGVVTKTCCLLGESKHQLTIDAVFETKDRMDGLKRIVDEGAPAGAPLRGKPLYNFLYAQMLPSSEQEVKNIFQLLETLKVELWGPQGSNMGPGLAGRPAPYTHALK